MSHRSRRRRHLSGSRRSLQARKPAALPVAAPEQESVGPASFTYGSTASVPPQEEYEELLNDSIKDTDYVEITTASWQCLERYSHSHSGVRRSRRKRRRKSRRPPNSEPANGSSSTPSPRPRHPSDPSSTTSIPIPNFRAARSRLSPVSGPSTHRGVILSSSSTTLSTLPQRVRDLQKSTNTSSPRRNRRRSQSIVQPGFGRTTLRRSGGLRVRKSERVPSLMAEEGSVGLDDHREGESEGVGSEGGGMGTELNVVERERESEQEEELERDRERRKSRGVVSGPILCSCSMVKLPSTPYLVFFGGTSSSSSVSSSSSSTTRTRPTPVPTSPSSASERHHRGNEPTNEVWVYSLNARTFEKVTFREDEPSTSLESTSSTSSSSGIVASHRMKSSHQRNRHPLLPHQRIYANSNMNMNMNMNMKQHSVVPNPKTGILTHPSSHILSLRPTLRCVEPCPRLGHCAVGLSSSEMLVFGGNDLSNQRLLNDLWLLKLEPREERRWRMIVPDVSAAGSSSSTVGGSAFVSSLVSSSSFGSSSAITTTTSTTTIDPSVPGSSSIDRSSSSSGLSLSFDSSSSSSLYDSSSSSNLPVPRWYASGCKYKDDFVFFFGGETSHFRLLDDVCVFSRQRSAWLNLRTIYPMPPARMLHSACILGGKMYIVGGLGAKSAAETCDVWSFDLLTMNWNKEMNASGPVGPFIRAGTPDEMLSQDGTMAPIYGHSMAPWGKRLVVYGGKRRNRPVSDLWILDLSTGKWERVPMDSLRNDLPEARWKHAAAVETVIEDQLEGLSREDRGEIASMRDFTRQHGLLPFLSSRHITERTTRMYIYGGIKAAVGRKTGQGLGVAKVSTNRPTVDLWELSLKTRQKERAMW